MSGLVHPLHSICPYFAMFPPSFVERQVLAFTNPGDIVFDPFSGRGTTLFESLLLSRKAYGLDVNPVAACVSGAKADPPTPANVLKRLSRLKEAWEADPFDQVPTSDFFRACFSPLTLSQIVFLRRELNWKEHKVDRFISTMVLGCLHGESHRSAACFSNRMPRTISTKPDYSVRWWAARGYEPPQRDVFSILRQQVAFRYARGVPPVTGQAKMGDVRAASKLFRSLQGKVKLVVTSPPYLDTTDYGEDQWLRLWFLGGAERPKGCLFPDGRHSCAASYWAFLESAWAGVAALLHEACTIVVRIGGAAFDGTVLQQGLLDSVRGGLGRARVELLQPLNVSEIRNRQTNAFRPGTGGQRLEYDFILRAAVS